ncbi:MAG: heme lyase CcmF/NrfE family subunit, partial [Candidatus Limnocylindria bacterium]
MLPTLGHVAVVIGLGASLYAFVAFVIGARRSDPRLVESARRAVYATCALAAVASTAMVVSLLTHDFSVSYVARNNATTTPPFYSIISLWAALEGSILFWTLLATGYASLVLWRYRARHPVLMPWVGATLAAIGVFLFAVMTWPGNPFTRMTPIPAEGNGPNALLQNHPFMGLHPPLLYLGYTGLAIPFAFGIAALVTRRTDEAWLGIVRRWTMVPWIFLTLGIIAGGWWSYEVLGWGGYWGWDPVENAALMPWLVGTAFLHSVMIQEKRGMLKIWNMILVIAAFLLVILGTFLTRSGVISSVHAFASGPIGPAFFIFIGITLVSSVGLLIRRRHDLRSEHQLDSLLSREAAFMLNNVLFLVITAVVLWGTILPMLTELFVGEKITVGPPFYQQLIGLLCVPLVVLMGIAPLIAWHHSSVQRLGRMVWK